LLEDSLDEEYWDDVNPTPEMLDWFEAIFSVNEAADDLVSLNCFN
jgi:hypothetical protein